MVAKELSERDGTTKMRKNGGKGGTGGKGGSGGYGGKDIIFKRGKKQKAERQKKYKTKM